MISEYALEPEMVATWRDRRAYRFFIREFGKEKGRLVSRYPKKWAKKVWRAFDGSSQMERKRLEELLTLMQKNMVKRKEIVWDENTTWLDNAIQEHIRYPFRAILARNNTENKPDILCEADFDNLHPEWDRHHGKSVRRNVPEMVEPVESMLLCCKWVKFIDPYISPSGSNYRPSLEAFLKILAGVRPVGLPNLIEIHTGLHKRTPSEAFLKEEYIKIIPADLRVTLYQWEAIPNEQELHNRYILTDIGGVAFLHGLDISKGSNSKDDVFRLDLDQYDRHYEEYNPEEPFFKQAADPIIITGT